MKRLLLFASLAILPLVALTPTRGADTGRAVKVVPTSGVLAGTQVYGNSHALLIGINQYPNLRADNALRFAVKDAEELRSVLVSQYGFPEPNITMLTDGQATRRAIEEALAVFADPGRVGPEDRLVVYFSGHGQTVKLPTGGEMGFLLPYDAKVDLSNADNASPYLISCLRMDTIWGYLESSPAKHALLVADACYSGILAGERGAGDRISPEALKALVSRRAMQIVTAGRKGEQSLENDKLGHGAFTYTLLEQLRERAKTPGDVFTVQDLFASLQRGVGNVTQGRQNPRLAARNTEGEFVFITAGGAAPEPIRPTQPGPGEATVPAPVPQPVVGALATTARLEVTTRPPGATVFLNENEEHPERTPCTVEIDLGRLRSRQIEIAVEKQGYRAAVRAVTLVRGQAARLSVTLEPLAGAPVTPPPPQPAVNPTQTAPPDPPAVQPQPVRPPLPALPPRDEMILIPEGVFTMGTKTRANELKPHAVVLPAYYIDKYEVTSDQYARFLNEAGQIQDAYGRSYVTVNDALPLERVEGQWRPKEGLANHPVVNVTWYGAAAYARWARKRLPTEAEWEKAARGADAFRYPWGNEWDPKRCNWEEHGAEDGFDSTAPVGSFAGGASPYGCMDMSGNVWEWTSSLDKPYPYRLDDGRENPDVADYRVMRGGSWRIDDPEFMTACVRLSNLPAYFNNRTGFRCARSAE